MQVIVDKQDRVYQGESLVDTMLQFCNVAHEVSYYQFMRGVPDRSSWGLKVDVYLGASKLFRIHTFGFNVSRTDEAGNSVYTLAEAIEYALHQAAIRLSKNGWHI